MTFNLSLQSKWMTILNDCMLEFVSGSPEQTRRLGARLGELLRGGEIICLEGELGAGKTCLAQGIGLGWGATQSLRSPSFTLIHEWKRPTDAQRLYHVDMYRIVNLAEAWNLGLEEIWDGANVCIIEWADRIAPLLPAERLWVKSSIMDDTRRQQVFTAQGERYMELLKRFRHAAFGV